MILVDDPSMMTTQLSSSTNPGTRLPNIHYAALDVSFPFCYDLHFTSNFQSITALRYVTEGYLPSRSPDSISLPKPEDSAANFSIIHRK